MANALTKEQWLKHLRELWKEALEQPMINGLTETETNQTMSVKRLSKQPAQVTRLEVIDNNGRAYVNMGVDKLEFIYQDDGRTLKLFTNGAGTLQPAQEPVLYIDQSGLDGHATWAQPNACQDTDIPLYTHPHQWQGNKDEK